MTTGALAIWIDGVLDGSSAGPAGDISYPDDGVPCSNCCGGGNCNFSDPFLVLGAEKHDAGAAYPSYSGFLDAACSQAAAGISRIKILDQTASSSPRVRFQVKAADASFALELAPVSLHASLGLQARSSPPSASTAAQEGGCGDYEWDPISFVRPAPYCKLTTARMSCRTP